MATQAIRTKNAMVTNPDPAVLANHPTSIEVITNITEKDKTNTISINIGPAPGPEGSRQA